MVTINELYQDYYQKSRLFLYPILGIRRGASVTPIGTYMSWFKEYAIDQSKLICTYYVRDDYEFKRFEEVELLGNPLFHRAFDLEDENMRAYVFDLSYNEDYACVLCGRYSMLSERHKRTVLDFFRTSLSNHTYMESFLYPEKYYNQYARLLTTEVKDRPEMLKLLKSVGELYDKPDLEKETLFKRKRELDFENKTVDLSDETNEQL